MEVEEIQTQQQSCKFSRVGSNGRNETTSSKLVNDKEVKSSNLGGGDGGGESNRFRGWHHHSSRIIRVTRASGGKDRHSKVWTSKGLRDRRVRLSVSTAIQFYDLQDRLGYDQPSKAVEWLIKAAADSIAELPTLNTPFPDTPKQSSDEKRCSDGGDQGFDSADIELEDGSFNPNQNQQHMSLSKSACSSNSETSKGSGSLSLSRSDIRGNRVKARERARERTAKEKESSNINPISQSTTFTELLTGGISSVNNNNNSNGTTATVSPDSDVNFFQKAATARQWPLMPMDYFNAGLIGTTTRSSGFPGQIQLGNPVPQAMAMAIPTFNVCGDNHHHQEQQQHMQQHFPFVSDHLIPGAATSTTTQQVPDYNLNFTISSSLGLAGFNRGTLQSNSSTSPSLLPHFQRFSSSMDGSTNVPFFIGAAAPPPTMDNHHHHNDHQFQSGLQLYYGDGSRHSDHKGKGKH